MTAFLVEHWRLSAALVITAVLSAYVLTLRLERDHYEAKYDREHAAFMSFTSKTEALGEQAKRDAAAKEAADKKRKDDADAKTTAALSTLATANGKLRDERDRAISRFLSASATCPGSPQGAAGAAERERAYRALVAGLRAVGAESDQRIVKFNGAKQWADDLSRAH